MVDLDTPVLQGMPKHMQDVLLRLIQEIVLNLPEDKGLQLLTDMRLIAEGCYQHDILNLDGKIH